ncbi:unnamed protein product [Penicillium bialowiezense]
MAPVPATIARSDDEVTLAGPWARFAQTIPWNRGKRGLRISTPLLGVLYREEAQREVTLRTSWGQTETSLRFHEEVGFELRHIEAVMIYITGVRTQAAPCRHCQEKRSPFPVCVFSPANGVSRDCANCHWAGKHCSSTDILKHSDILSYYKEPLAVSDQFVDLEHAIEALDFAKGAQPVVPETVVAAL